MPHMDGPMWTAAQEQNELINAWVVGFICRYGATRQQFRDLDKPAPDDKQLNQRKISSIVSETNHLYVAKRGVSNDCVVNRPRIPLLEVTH